MICQGHKFFRVHGHCPTPTLEAALQINQLGKSWFLFGSLNFEWRAVQGIAGARTSIETCSLPGHRSLASFRGRRRASAAYRRAPIKTHGRVRLTNNDRWFFIQLYRWFPSTLKVLTIIQPETLVRWHRAGFRCYWRWKSRPPGGRPQIDTELRVSIRWMSVENPLWGAPRIHGELLKLGFEVAQSSVAKYMVKRRGPPPDGGSSRASPDIPRQVLVGRAGRLTAAAPPPHPDFFMR